MELRELKVYEKSQALLSEALGVANRLPRGWGWLADQMRRCGGSVPLNVAEARSMVR